MVKIEIGKVMNLKRITKNNQPTKFPFVVTSEAGFGAGTPQQEHFKNAGALQKCSPGGARNLGVDRRRTDGRAVRSGADAVDWRDDCAARFAVGGPERTFKIGRASCRERV